MTESTLTLTAMRIGKPVHTPQLAYGVEAPWMREGLCRTGDPERFFPHPRGEADRRREARTVCLACPVREACRDHALKHNEGYGIWGGLTETERNRINRGESVRYIEARAFKTTTPKPPPPAHIRTCPTCNTTFHTPHNATRYCQPTCKPQRVAAPLRTITCRCGTQFTGDKRARHCSSRCRAAHHRETTGVPR